MAFLRLKDYEAVIRPQQLAEILQGNDFVRTESELIVQEHIETLLRHRYNMVESFISLHTFSVTTAFKQGDILEYTENDYLTTTSYIAGQRVAYLGTIYEATGATLGNLPTDVSFWSLICVDLLLYTCKVNSTGQTPDNILDYGSPAFVGGLHEVKGWNRGLPLYFSMNNSELKIFLSSSERDTQQNYVGAVKYSSKPLELPSVRQILKGSHSTVSLAGNLTITDFISEGATFEVTPTNYFSLGDERPQLLKSCMLKMSVYEIHSVINPRNVPDLRKDAYAESLGLLEQIAKGTISANLPTYIDRPEKGQAISWGSANNTKYTW